MPTACAISIRAFQNRIVGAALSDIRPIGRLKILLEATLLDHLDCLANGGRRGRKQSAVLSA
ncbi:MAG: hypothetical protein ACR2JE_01595 [Acidobacteriaceae bacterium]